MKKLSSKADKGTKEFLNEVFTLSTVHHRNLVKLLGCCVQGQEKILVFEFLENNSLSQYLLGNLLTFLLTLYARHLQSTKLC
mgnify:FL=1